MLHPIDRDHNLIQVPFVVWSWPFPANPVREMPAKSVYPKADGSNNLAIPFEFMRLKDNVITQARPQQGWTQEHLASVAGVSTRTIQRVEASDIASAHTA